MFRIITCLIFTNKIFRVSAHSEPDLQASELIGDLFFALSLYLKQTKYQQQPQINASRSSVVVPCTQSGLQPHGVFPGVKNLLGFQSPRSVSGARISSYVKGHLPESL